MQNTVGQFRSFLLEEEYARLRFLIFLDISDTDKEQSSILDKKQRSISDDLQSATENESAASSTKVERSQAGDIVQIESPPTFPPSIYIKPYSSVGKTTPKGESEKTHRER